MRKVRWFPIVMIAASLVTPSMLGGRAWAGQPEDEYALQRRVTEGARMLAGNPRLKGMSEAQRERLVEFVAGNLLFALGHEAGHATISEMGIPVVGREEDAADVFSTLMALMCHDSFADRVLANAALGWFLSDRRDRRQGVQTVYYDEHGMDLQRAYNVVCLMVGSNMGKFAVIAERARLPAERQMTCQDDYLNASWSWEQVLKPHLRQPDQPKTAINVAYGPGNGEYDSYAEVAQHIRILETLADTLSDRYVWRAPITLEMQSCGDANARWEFRAKKVTICYELAAELSELYRMYGNTMAFTLGENASAVTPRREGDKVSAVKPRRDGGRNRKSLGSKRAGR